MRTKTWFSIKNFAPATPEGTPTATVSIHDEIGCWGVSAKDFIDAFRAIPENAAITLSVHSPGGSVMDGLAIHNTIKAASARVTARVEGFAASAASMVVMAASKIIMPANSYMMIHNPSALAWGDEQAMRDMADLLASTKNMLVNIYTHRTGVDEATVRTMLDEETWMTGEEAVAMGFADELAEAVKMVACANPHALAQFKALPDAIKAKDETTPGETAFASKQTATDSAMPAASVIAACTAAGYMQLAEGLVRNQSTPEQVTNALQRAQDIATLGEAAQAPELAQQLIAANASLEVARISLQAVRAASAVAVQGHKPAGDAVAAKQEQTATINHFDIYARRKPAATTR